MVLLTISKIITIKKKCIRKYWFTKQIEEWKKDDNNKNKEPTDEDLMDIVKKDLKIRIANTMLELKQELKKQKDIQTKKLNMIYMMKTQKKS